MRKGTTEYALGIIFYVDNGYEAHHSVGEIEKLCSPDFKLPFSIIYGDQDWALENEEGVPEQLIMMK